MSDPPIPAIGTIAWCDLTVEDAEQLRDFYSVVVGWQVEPVNMAEYDDYSMLQPNSTEAVAGVCHARGTNANLPPQWLIYITVDDVDASARRCVELGGKIIDGPRSMGSSRFCVIKDPAGAVAALYAP